MTATSVMAKTERRGYSIGGVITLGLVGGIISAEPIISNVAIVGADHDLGMSASAQTLAVSLATLVLAATIIAVASWSDRIGRRKGLLTGLALVFAGDVLTGLSASTGMFLGARVITGLGSALLLATSFSMLKSVVSNPAKLGVALGLWVASFYVSPTVFSGFGGALNNIDWRYAFFVVPVGAVILALMAWKFLPETREPGKDRIDFLGLSVLGLGMILALLGLSKASDSFSAPTTWIPILIGLGLIVCYYFIEKKISNPSFPVSILKNPIFVGAMIAGVMWNLTEAAFLFQTALFWQYVYDFQPFQVVVAQAPLTVGGIIGAFVVGGILSKGAKPRTVILVGCIFMFIAFIGISFSGVDTPYWAIGPFVFLAGVGVVTVATPQAGLFVAHAPKKFLGTVTASRAASGQLGYAIGLAGGAALMSLFTKQNFTEALEEAHIPSDEWGSFLTQADGLLFKGQAPTGSLQEKILAEAAEQYASGFSSVMLVMAGIILVAGVAVTILLRMTQTQETLGEMEEEEEALDASAGDADPA